MGPTVDILGTFEIHQGHEGIEEDPGNLTDYIDFSNKVKDIDNNDHTSITEKVKKKNKMFKKK